MKSHGFPRTLRVLMFAAVLAPPAATRGVPPSEPGTTLEIDLKAPSTPISPILHGLMTEEINHSYDGGLYAELIRNRTFLDQSQSTEDVLIDYRECPGTPGTASRLAIVGAPVGITPGVAEHTVFGEVRRQ
jgi:hypothetical protein